MPQMSPTMWMPTTILIQIMLMIIMSLLYFFNTTTSKQLLTYPNPNPMILLW